MSAAIAGPAWDLSGEYASCDSPALEADLQALSELLDEIEQLNTRLTSQLDDGAAAVPDAQAVYRLSERGGKLLSNVGVYANCLLSVDSQDEAAQGLNGRLLAFQKRFGELMEPLNQFTDRSDEAVISAYLAGGGVADSEFLVRHGRKRSHEILGLAEENLQTALAQDGIHAWGRLYDQLTGTMTCDVPAGNETETMGVAQASGLLLDADDRVRRDAWQAINEAYATHEESCAAAINAIAGWRLEMCKKRSHAQRVHYLDAPVHANRIERHTLDVLMGAAESGRALAQRAAKLQARAYGKAQIGPWDMRAPAPALPGAEAEPITFDAALDMIAEAYGRVHPEMGDFVRMMAENRWIEGTVGERKRPGAYCTSFAKSKTPRVYMTYTGGISNVITLAHELGHAYHSWVMRDLPDSQRSYGMSLAETASTFGETLVRDALLERAATPAQKLDIAWEEVGALVAFVLNIPTRFEFETRFYDARLERPQRPEALRELMSDAWRRWYGDSLSEPDPLFWANKLHFYISGLSFYNFPYLFGYLFSLGIYARRGAFGESFFDRYVGLLRDTGRMTAEELTRKHLDADLSEPSFWTDTLASLEPKVDQFEILLETLDL